MYLSIPSNPALLAYLIMARMGTTRASAGPSQPRVAVCFTGFVRNHTSLARDIDRILGDATYHAFIVAPLQHFELDASPHG